MEHALQTLLYETVQSGFRNENLEVMDCVLAEYPGAGGRPFGEAGCRTDRAARRGPDAGKS